MSETNEQQSKHCGSGSELSGIVMREEGSYLLAQLFNLMTTDQKNSLNEEDIKRLVGFMTKNGYRIVFDKWYLQAEPEINYGCHVDLEPGIKPDGCVIETGDFHNCTHAHEGMKTEDCEYWKAVDA